MKVSIVPVRCLVGIFPMLLGMGQMAQAETVCQEPWAVQSKKVQQGLIVEFKEKGQQGPACDLVVQGFQFNEEDKSVSIDIRPTSFCPVEALKERSAHWLWVLPFNYRNSQNDLRLIVNGRETGSLHIDGSTAVFEGGCK